MQRYLLTLALCLSTASTAGAGLHEIFGLTDFSITPPSGAATSADPIHIALEGVAPSSLVPFAWNLSPGGPNELTIHLVNPYDVGATVLTPWSFGVDLPALAPGEYDLYLRAEVGSPPYHVSDRELLVADFLVQRALPGDFDGNGLVDDDDYQWWREHYTTGGMSAADYVVWRNNVGKEAGRSGVTAAIPEPSAAMLLVLLPLMTLGFRRQRS